MQNREPTYPGRVTLTPVAGLANTYDMDRADQPLQQGTPLTKATFLKDATAALFGKTNAAVPDDILSLLSKSVLAQTVGGDTNLTDVLGTKLTVGVQIETGSYVGTGTYGQANPNTLTFGFVPKLVFVVAINNYASFGTSAIFYPFAMTAEYVNGMYVYGSTYNNSNNVAKMDGTTMYWYSSSNNAQINVNHGEYKYFAIG